MDVHIHIEKSHLVAFIAVILVISAINFVQSQANPAVFGHIWEEIANKPAGLDDGDDDTVGALLCGDSQSVQYDSGSASWGCADVTTVTSIDGLSGGTISSSVEVRGSLTLDTDAADGPQIRLYDNTGTPWEIDNNNGNLRFFRPGSVKLTLHNSGGLKLANVGSLSGIPCNSANEGMLVYLSSAGTFLACLRYQGSLVWYDLR